MKGPWASATVVSMSAEKPWAPRTAALASFVIKWRLRS